MSGSIRSAGKRMRATVDLIDARSERTIWNQSFDQAGYEDVLDVQSDIAREITRRIEPELARAEFTRVERGALENLDAWELYHKTQGMLVLKGLTRGNLRQAVELLRRAVTIDPDFALAHAHLTGVYAWCNALKIDLGEPDLPDKAMASLNRALELDRRNHTVLGFTGCALCDLHHHQRGLDLLEQAIELDPSNALAQAGLGAGLLAARRSEEGIERLRKGIRLSPLDERVVF